MKVRYHKPSSLTLVAFGRIDALWILRVGEGGLIVCWNGRCAIARVEDVENSLLEIAACIKHDYENGFEVKEDCGGTTGVPGSGCEYRIYRPGWVGLHF